MVIGNYAFSGVDYLTLDNLPALTSLDFGYGAFFGYSRVCTVESAVTLNGAGCGGR